jgi:hypothetical protein
MGTFYEGTGQSFLPSNPEGGALPHDANVASHATHHGFLGSKEDGFYKADMEQARAAHGQAIEVWDDLFMKGAFDHLVIGVPAVPKGMDYGLTDPVAPIPRLTLPSSQVFLSAGGGAQ